MIGLSAGLAAILSLPHGADVRVRDSGAASSGDRSVDMMMTLINKNYTGSGTNFGPKMTS